MSFLRLTVIEMRRALHRRVVRGMVLLALLLCLIPAIAAFVSSADPVKLAASPDHPAHMSQWWIAGGEGFLMVAAIFLVIGAAICAASVVGAEWKAGTIATVLTWEPSRWRVHGARTLSAFVLSYVISLALQAVFLASTLPAVIAHGTTDGTDAAWWAALVLAMLRISLITSLVAVLAVSIATIGRNTSAALIAIAAWALAVERLVAGLRPQWARFMITENVATVVPWTPLDDVEFERSPSLALATLVVYLALVVLAAGWSFRRRDVATA
jgi:ABC-type transport system involved in multi-copper enzyme maturation permease subunit